MSDVNHSLSSQSSPMETDKLDDSEYDQVDQLLPYSHNHTPEEVLEWLATRTMRMEELAIKFGDLAPSLRPILNSIDGSDKDVTHHFWMSVLRALFEDMPAVEVHDQTSSFYDKMHWPLAFHFVTRSPPDIFLTVRKSNSQVGKVVFLTAHCKQPRETLDPTRKVNSHLAPHQDVSPEQYVVADLFASGHFTMTGILRQPLRLWPSRIREVKARLKLGHNEPLTVRGSNPVRIRNNVTSVDNMITNLCRAKENIVSFVGLFNKTSETIAEPSQFREIAPRPGKNSSSSSLQNVQTAQHTHSDVAVRDEEDHAWENGLIDYWEEEDDVGEYHDAGEDDNTEEDHDRRAKFVVERSGEWMAY